MHEDTIYLILEYVQKKKGEIELQARLDRPIQEPFSRWAIDEVISQLKMDYTSYPDEVVRNFISLMDKYEEVAEPERKSLFRIAKSTAEDLYSYLFNNQNENRKESIPF